MANQNTRLRYSALLNDALDMVRDSSGGHLTTNNRLRAANRVLDEVAMAFDGEYTSRRKVISYLNNEPNYHLENNLSILDFKNPDDLRLQDDHNVMAGFVTPKEFAVREGQGDTTFCYTIETRNGEKILRILYDSGSDNIVITPASDNTEGGATWVGTDDATTPTQDTKISKVYGSSIKFNIDVDASANDYATITLSGFTAVDLSNYENIGKLRNWLFLPVATGIDSCSLRWGQVSNYWEVAEAETNALGQSFENGFNRVEFDWANAEIGAGTPNASAVNWIQLVINHSLTADLNGVRVNEFKCFNPIYMDLHYYSDYLAKDSSGNIIDDIETTTDEILFPVNFRLVLIAGLTYQFFGMIKGWNAQETLYWKGEFDRKMRELRAAYGHTNRRPMPHIKLRY